MYRSGHSLRRFPLQGCVHRSAIPHWLYCCTMNKDASKRDVAFSFLWTRCNRIEFQANLAVVQLSSMIPAAGARLGLFFTVRNRASQCKRMRNCRAPLYFFYSSNCRPHIPLPLPIHFRRNRPQHLFVHDGLAVGHPRQTKQRLLNIRR